MNHGHCVLTAGLGYHLEGLRRWFPFLLFHWSNFWWLGTPAPNPFLELGSCLAIRQEGPPFRTLLKALRLF